MNILSNAVKYNKENGYIYISCQEFTSEQEGRVTIEFICRDTGIGMTKDFQKRLFEPFAQEHTGSRTKFFRNRAWNADHEKTDRKNGRNDHV